MPSAMKTATKDASAGGWFWGTGRRKASVARVRVRPGDGTFMVNKRPMTTFFTEERDHQDLMNVLETTRTTGQVEIQCNVRGGGYTGQAGAILLGLGRALLNYDSSLEPISSRAWLPDTGPTTRGTQEARSARCSKAIPVLQAIVDDSSAIDFIPFDCRRAHCRCASAFPTDAVVSACCLQSCR